MAETAKKELPKLEITCTTTACDKQLHAFKPKPSMKPEEHGECRACGTRVVDFERTHLRDPGDIEYLRTAFNAELIRHKFWEIEVPATVRELAVHPRRPLQGMIETSLRSRIAPPASELAPWDGRQTPFPHKPDARIYHYGQHATGTCCRGCLEYWHGIAQELPLGKKELDYAKLLVNRYIDEKLG